jgi:putative SOS response-associated peptidase YedK
MSELHDRMPLVLEEPVWRLWLGEVLLHCCGRRRTAR